MDARFKLPVLVALLACVCSCPRPQTPSGNSSFLRRHFRLGSESRQGQQTVTITLVAASCYPVAVTTVEIVFRLAAPPTEQAALALGRARDVYGIRQLSFDREARTVRVEFDATRLNAAAVAKLLRAAGLDLIEEPIAPTV
jgi:hypothetical protein